MAGFQIPPGFIIPLEQDSSGDAFPFVIYRKRQAGRNGWVMPAGKKDEREKHSKTAP